MFEFQITISKGRFTCLWSNYFLSTITFCDQTLLVTHFRLFINASSPVIEEYMSTVFFDDRTYLLCCESQNNHICYQILLSIIESNHYNALDMCNDFIKLILPSFAITNSNFIRYSEYISTLDVAIDFRYMENKKIYSVPL